MTKRKDWKIVLRLRKNLKLCMNYKGRFVKNTKQKNKL